MDQQPKIQLSIRDSFQDRTILAIGTTGFLGKVWLTMLLSQVQTFKKIYVLIRGKGSQSGKDRFVALVNSSYVFQPLHEEMKDRFSTLLRQKIEVVEGDVYLPNLGLSDELAQKIWEETDIVVNFAGLVDFNPDLREAFSINVQGAMNVAEFTTRCKQKKLVHVSTCYVAGVAEGLVDEEISTTTTPNGKKLDVDYELSWIQENIQSTLQEYNSEEQLQAARKLIVDRNTDASKRASSEGRIKKTIETIKRKKLREAMIKVGKDHAVGLGWTNTYTYSKGLAETLLKLKYPNIQLVIFRPSIVESSLSFPFPGWNEGFNTSGPLAYLMKTWFRHLPLTKGNPFDVIPVDFVSRGLTIASAALLQNVHKEVYHCATSHKNRLTIDQACYFTSESHSIFYKKYGDDWKERMILSRWRTIPSRKDHILATPNLKKYFSAFQKAISTTGPFKPFLKSTNNWILKINRKLEQTDRLLELFYPFIHDYRHVFVTDNLYLYDIAEKEFAFSIGAIVWKDYWQNIHMPGLRQWCFPVIEGKSVEKYNPIHPFSFTIANGNGNGHSINGKNPTNQPSNVKMVRPPHDHESISKQKVIE